MMQKKAFTLFESLLVIMIIGILVLLSLKILKNADEKAYGELYTKAYTTLNTAAYNVQYNVERHNDQAHLEAQREGNSVAADSELKRFPDVEKTVVNPTDQELCTALTSNDKGYINVVSSNCATSTSNTNMIANTIPSTPTFVTTDGMKYYFATPADSTTFFYVWVDINGNRRPNSTTFVTGKKRPDIVPFIISKENGVVVPQGIPTYDITYLKARVLSSNPDLDVDYSRIMTFYEAQRIAFDGSTWTLDPLSNNIAAFNKQITDAKMLKPTPDNTIKSTLKCSKTGYNTTRDFPPCTVGVNVFKR